MGGMRGMSDTYLDLPEDVPNQRTLAGPLGVFPILEATSFQELDNDYP